MKRLVRKKQGPSAEKAKEMLKDGKVHGKPLTDKQKRYFGWVAGGSKQNAGSAGNPYSIVDYLKSKGMSSDKVSRKALAKSMGISNYRYTAAQNLQMLQMLRDLEKQKQQVPEPEQEPEEPQMHKHAYPPPKQIQQQVEKAIQQVRTKGVPPPESMRTPPQQTFGEYTGSVIPDELKPIFGPDTPAPVIPAGVPPGKQMTPGDVPDYDEYTDANIPAALRPVYGKEPPPKPTVKKQLPVPAPLKGVPPPKSMGPGKTLNYAQHTNKNIPVALRPVYGKTPPVAKPVVVKGVAPPASMAPAGTPSYKDYTSSMIPEGLETEYIPEVQPPANTIVQQRAPYTGPRIAKSPQSRYVASSTRVEPQDPSMIAPQMIPSEPGMLENALSMVSNWWQRSSKKSDENLQEAETHIAQPNYNPTIITGDTLRDDKRQYRIPEIIDLNNVTLGTRSRGERAPIDTEGGILTTFTPFVNATEYFQKSKDPVNATYIGISDDGKVKTGNKSDFADGQYKITRSFSNKVIDFNKEKDGSIWLVNSDPKASKTMLSPSIKVLGEDGTPKNGRLSILIPKGTRDTKSYGAVTGGRYIFKKNDGQMKLVSGSLNDLATQFYSMKGDDPYLEVITLDNGTYSRGLRTYDKKITGADQQKYDALNAAPGGNFAYLLPGNYSDSKQRFQETYLATPNVRTKNDPSYYEKGHPLKNEASTIVLHHTGFTDPKRAKDQVTDLFMTPGQNSAHVMINFDGSRTRFANPDQVTFHAGVSEFKGRDNVNDFSIGVEFQGDTNKRPLTDLQIESFVEYALPLIQAKGMTLADITTHHRIAGERKPDITDKEYARIIKALRERGVEEGSNMPAPKVKTAGYRFKDAQTIQQDVLRQNAGLTYGPGNVPNNTAVSTRVVKPGIHPTSESMNQRLAAAKAVKQAILNKRAKDVTTKGSVTEGNFTTAEKYRMFPQSVWPEPGAMFDETINPFYQIGAMAQGLGNNLGSPAATFNQLGMTALAGRMGLDPVGFTGKTISAAEGVAGKIPGLLPNAYKVNPWAFKPTEGMMYRGIGEAGLEDAISSGVFRSPKARPSYKGLNPQRATYWADNDNFQTAINQSVTDVERKYPNSVIAEYPRGEDVFKLRNTSKGKFDHYQTDVELPVNEGRILRQHWLKGYKEVPKSTTNVGETTSASPLSNLGDKTLGMINTALDKVPQDVWNFPARIESGIKLKTTGMKYGIQHLKAGRPFRETFPLTASQKAEQVALQQQAANESKDFALNWVYDRNRNVRPEFRERVANLMELNIDKGDPKMANIYKDMVRNPGADPVTLGYNNPYNPLVNDPNMVERSSYYAIRNNPEMIPELKRALIKDRASILGKHIHQTPYNPSQSVSLSNIGPYSIQPSLVGETSIHELGHAMQNMGFNAEGSHVPWIKTIDQYNPESGYYSANLNTDIGKEFGEAMVEPVKGKGIWEASPAELHADLMKARKRLYEIGIKDQVSYADQVMASLQDPSDNTIDHLIETGNLNRFFKPTTDIETKRKLIKILPAILPVAGVGAAATQNQNAGRVTKRLVKKQSAY